MIPIFYANKPDDNHCLQASVLMVLNSLGHDMSWEQVNKLTKYDDRYYSWTIVAASIVSQYIPNTRLVTGLDYKKLANDGEEYLKFLWPSQWYESQRQHASPGFKREQQFAKDFKGKFELVNRKLSSEELSNLIKDNLIISLINPYIIRAGNGVSGHFVVVYDSVDDRFIYHDPGNPPIEKAQANKDVFLSAANGEFLIIPKNK